MLKVSILRNKTELQKIPAAAGYYKWWCEKAELDVILNALDVKPVDVQQAIERQDDLFCVYVGIAAKESVRARLNWHVNDKHTASRVKSGTLSTLRQSIASIVANNQFDKEATDSFIDKLHVEWFCIDSPIKSAEAKAKLYSVERNLLFDRLRILNIKDNLHPLAEPIKFKLKMLRKNSKIIAKRQGDKKCY